MLAVLPFETAVDAFSGSGCVGYLLKAMGKQVLANDFLNFTSVVARAIIENSASKVDDATVERLMRPGRRRKRFIERTFTGIFYTPEDLRFLDRIWWNIQELADPSQRAVALAALIRACVKRQPRGVFTVAGDPQHYKDGRRDLSLSLREHFVEQVKIYNAAVFDNGHENRVVRGDVFDIETGYDLVYLDPPYVPRADDNCYVKRYHFLEGLSCYWQGVEILPESRVRKLRKPYTPFSYRSKAEEAFDAAFARFRESILVLSYSSNGFPDLDVIVRLMQRYKRQVKLHERAHRYHFGTHKRVKRSSVREYLVVGT